MAPMILATLKAVVEDGRPKFGTRIMYWMFGKLGFVLPRARRVEALADVNCIRNERGTPWRPSSLLLPRRFRARPCSVALALAVALPLAVGLGDVKSYHSSLTKYTGVPQALYPPPVCPILAMARRDPHVDRLRLRDPTVRRCTITGCATTISGCGKRPMSMRP